MIPRIIPVILIDKGRMYKTIRFKDPKYIGDPVNAVKVFNEKCVDELILLDFRATVEKRSPDFKLIENIASQCFMPLCYGGGLKNIEDISRIINCGVEKVSINSAAAENQKLVEEAAEKFGSSAIVLSMDVRRLRNGEYEISTHSGTNKIKTRPDEYVQLFEKSGIGEILINSIDRDGTMQGYDHDIIKIITDSVNVPVISCGGAGKTEHFKTAFEYGATALAAGSMFVFQGKHRGVLINYPDETTLKSIFID